MKNPVIHLDPRDNVAVCRRAVVAGERFSIADREIIVAQDTQLGHKIACAPIGVGAAIVKYGMAIGSATIAIAAGDWVHLHNLRSNYIATHTRVTTGGD